MPRLRLHAPTLRPYVGQEIDLHLDVDIPKSLANEPAMQLEIPWLTAEFGFQWSFPPDQWLCRRAASNRGTSFQINSWPAPLRVKALSADAGKQVPGADRYRFTWKLIVKEADPLLPNRVITFEPVQLTVSQSMARSNALELAVQDLPVPHRQLPRLNLGVGAYRLEAVTVQHSNLVLGQETLLTLKLSGSGPLARVPRPKLAALPEFHRDDFLIEDAGETWSDDKTARLFRYRLRPRHLLEVVPAIPYTYFDPKIQDYQTGATKPAPLVVRPQEIAEAFRPPYPPGQVPERLQLVPPNPDLLTQEAIWPKPVFLWLLLAVPPVLVAGLWLIRSRQRWESERPHRRWSRAAKEAFRLIHSSANGNEAVADDITQAVATYLHQRYRLEVTEPTPGDIEAPLQKAEVPAATIAQVSELLRACASARFAGANSIQNGELVQMAENVVQRLEESSWNS